VHKVINIIVICYVVSEIEYKSMGFASRYTSQNNVACVRGAHFNSEERIINMT